MATWEIASSWTIEDDSSANMGRLVNQREHANSLPLAAASWIGPCLGSVHLSSYRMSGSNSKNHGRTHDEAKR